MSGPSHHLSVTQVIAKLTKASSFDSVGFINVTPGIECV